MREKSKATRQIAGYAAIFDTPDRGGDIVRRGAFAGSAGRALPLYWQHDPARKVGQVEWLAEDHRGLRVIARLDAHAPDITAGHGLSFGYRTRGAINGTYRELTKLELLEISLVSNPMQPLATVLAVAPSPQLAGVFHEGEDNGL
jgi:uncharacterized protein